MTRTCGHFWLLSPSRWVGWVIAINIVLATLMAASGWFMASAPMTSIALLFIIILLAMMILDRLKIWYYGRTGFLLAEKRGTQYSFPNFFS